uniref:Uncharacterized protein n=1 Tax=Streptomyces sp. NBC_00049 TaxID=2903617 RepID=A0AAU2K2G7_9ACTN
MVTIKIRRVALLIATLLAGGGTSLATTAHAASNTAPVITTDEPGPVKNIGTAEPKSIKRIGRANNPGTAMHDAKMRADSFIDHSKVAGRGGSAGGG